MRRVVVTLVVIATCLVVALPAAAAPPDNPLVGSWENDDVDGSHQHMTLGNGNSLPFTFRDDGATICEDAGLGFVPARLKGEAEILNPADPLLLVLSGDVYCYPRGPGGPQVVAEDIFLLFFYDPATDTIFDVFAEACWYRSGNQESCTT